MKPRLARLLACRRPRGARQAHSHTSVGPFSQPQLARAGLRRAPAPSSEDRSGPSWQVCDAAVSSLAACRALRELGGPRLLARLLSAERQWPIGLVSASARSASWVR